jgi:hypothetical protein
LETNVKKTAIFLTSLALSVSGAAMSPTAHASTALPSSIINHSCGPKQNPNRLIDQDTRKKTKIGSALIELRIGWRSSDRYHAYLWAKISHASAGNTVWLDWADNAYDTVPSKWHECGPVKVHSGHDQHTLAVNDVNDNYNSRKFRACGHHAGVTRCTSWRM